MLDFGLTPSDLFKPAGFSGEVSSGHGARPGSTSVFLARQSMVKDEERHPKHQQLIIVDPLEAASPRGKGYKITQLDPPMHFPTLISQ